MNEPENPLYGHSARPWDLEPHYCNHVEAMTREKLHDKSEIAAELAWRDQRIEHLESERNRLLVFVESISGPATSSWRDDVIVCGACGAMWGSWLPEIHKRECLYVAAQAVLGKEAHNAEI